MLNVVVLVSGGGTNLQAIIDAVDSGEITNTKIAASSVIIRMHMHWSVLKNMGFRISVYLQKIMKAVRLSIRNL